MSEQASSFGEDLRRIRERKGISLEEIHKRSKVGLDNISLFEEGKLQERRHFNEVYLRALAREYAQVLDISVELTIDSLDRALGGKYDGQLADEYLTGTDQPEEPPAQKDEGVSASRPSDTGEPPLEEGPNLDREAPDDEDGPTTRGPNEDERTDEDDLEDADVPLPRIQGTPLSLEDEDEPKTDEPEPVKEKPPVEPRPEPSEETVEEESAEPSEVVSEKAESTPTYDVTAPPTPSRSSSRSGGRGSLSRNGRSRVLRLLGISVLVLVLLGGMYWVLRTSWWEGDLTSSTGDSEVATDTVEDTLNAAGVAPQQQTPAPPAIGDSIDFIIIAAEDKVNPIRIRLDGGEWNPYWIEHGDSMTFAARDSFTLRSYLQRVQLLVENESYPVAAPTDYARMTVTRSGIESYLDSLYSVSR